MRQRNDPPDGCQGAAGWATMAPCGAPSPAGRRPCRGPGPTVPIVGGAAAASPEADVTTRSQPRQAHAHRADAFARLFEAVHEGVFIGALAGSNSEGGGTTLAANPHLKLIFGYPTDTPE